jgi:hypothetical protein
VNTLGSAAYSVSTYRSFAVRASQLKLCDLSGESFQGFEVL